MWFLGSLNLICGTFGLLIAVSTLKKFRTNKRSIYIGLVTTIISATHILIGVNFYEDFISLRNFDYISFQLFIIPLVFLYLHIDNSRSLKLKDSLHFTAPLVMLSVILLNNNSMIDFNDKYIFILFNAFVIYSIIYGYLILKALEKVATKEKSLNKSGIKINLRWYYTLVLIAGSILTKEIIENSYILFIDKDNLYTKSYWINCILWLYLFLYIFKYPYVPFNDIYKNDTLINNNIKIINTIHWSSQCLKEIENKQDKILHNKIESNITHYMIKLDNYFNIEGIFRSSDVKLIDIAHKMEIPYSHLVFLFKYHSKLTFLEIKRIIRIKDSMKLIQKGYLKSSTLESLAYEVGFKSYNPFFTSFKNLLNITPNEYSTLVDKNNRGKTLNNFKVNVFSQL